MPRTQHSLLITHHFICRWLLALGLGLGSAAAAGAQVNSPNSPDCICPDRPAQLPPLLTPPTGDPNAPPPASPRGPTGEYDHGYLYLPESAPPAPTGPEQCRPLGRWWVSPTLELAWLPKNTLPGTVRLRVPDGRGGSIPGPVLPTGGVSTDDFLGGFSLVLGRWFGETNTHGVEASFFTVGNDTTFTGFAPGMLVVFPNGTNASAPQVIVLPQPLADAVVGVFPATLSTWFVGADVNYRQNLYCSPHARLDGLVGYRFAYLRDELYPGEPPDPGQDDHGRNRAAVTNPFHGGQIGLAGEFRADAWYVSGAAKVAFGVVTPDVSVSGMFVGADGLTGSGFTRLVALSAPTHSLFAVLPTLNVTIGRQIREHARVFAGYSFQYLSRVVRLNDVLEPTAGTTVPVTDFWVQSVNFGLELRY
jgi:hypothetical protein